MALAAPCQLDRASHIKLPKICTASISALLAPVSPPITKISVTTSVPQSISNK